MVDGAVVGSITDKTPVEAELFWSSYVAPAGDVTLVEVFPEGLVLSS